MSVDTYRDTNNFLNLNNVVTKDNRFLAWREKYFSFFDIHKGMEWHSVSYTVNHMISTDGGDSYQETNDEIYCGTYFYLGTNVTEHERDFFDIIDFVSRAGGIFATLISFFGGIGKYVNTQSFMSELMTEMQYVSLKNPDEIASDKVRITQVSQLLYDIHHNTSDTFSHVKTNLYETCICCLKRGRKSREYLTPTEYFFQRGYAKLEKEFESVNVLK